VHRTYRSILALTAILGARAIHAQSDELSPPLGEIPRPIGIASSEEGKANGEEKQKVQILLLLGHTRALARWMPNEASFLTVVDRVQERLVAAKEIELAPLLEFDPYLSSLTATLARMEARVTAVQAAAAMIAQLELRDPDGRVLAWDSILITDTDDLRGMVAKHSGDRSPPATPSDKDPVRFFISTTLARPGAAPADIDELVDADTSELC